MYLKEEREIFFIDQTTFNMWHTKSHTWQNPNDRLAFCQQNIKGKSFTVYGALQHKAGRFHFFIGKGTTIDNFLEFMEKIERTESMKESVIVLDNHSSHRSMRTQSAVAETGAKILFLPPYSSELNPIEQLWSVIKNQWRKLIMRWMGEVPQETQLMELKGICRGVDKYKLQNFSQAIIPKLITLLNF